MLPTIYSLFFTFFSGHFLILAHTLSEFIEV